MASLSISAYAADAGYAARDIKRIHKSGADGVHIDVMDGHFVSLTGLGISWMEAMKERISLPMDVHFMTLTPQRFIRRFLTFDITSAVFHIEAVDYSEILNALALFFEHGIRGGLAISPGTDVTRLYPYLDKLEELLVMTSQPGEAEAGFIPGSIERIRTIRRLVDTAGAKARISVDGGLDETLAKECIAAGAHRIILGRSFFMHGNPKTLASSIHQYAASPGVHTPGISRTP